MKKLLSILLIISTLLILLTGCSSDTELNPNAELITEKETENITEEPTEKETEPEKVIEIKEPYKRGEKIKVVGIIKTQPTKTASNCIEFQLLSYGELLYVVLASDLESSIEINDVVEIEGVYNGLTYIEAYDTQEEMCVIYLYGKNVTVTSFETPTEAPTQSPTEAPTEKPTTPQTIAPTIPETEAPTQPQTEKAITKIEVVKEYTYSDGFWYTYHFVVVKNVGNVPLSMNTSTLAYGSDGSLISVATGSIDVLEPNCITMYYESFETTSTIARYETKQEIEQAKYYKYGAKNLSYTQTKIENGEIIQVTNNDTKAIDFVRGYLLYFKDGNIIDWDCNYFTDNDYEIKSGETISKQYSIYNDYDYTEFYLTGRG